MMSTLRSRMFVSVGVIALLGAHARGALSIITQFNPGMGDLVAMGFDPSSDRVWTHGAFGASLRSFTPVGGADATIPRPGGSADDFDISFAPEQLNIAGTIVPKDTLLAINGESGVCEVYAINKTTGAILATLTTAFGESHVVGGTYHAGRNTIFLVQDRNAATPSQRSIIAEINPVTGAVINTFSVTVGDWTVNYGDVEVHPSTGRLWVVSSDETIVREYSPDGVLIAVHTLPVGVTEVSGISFDVVRGEAWVSGSESGIVWRLAGANAPQCPGDINGDGVVNTADFNLMATNFGVLLNATRAMGDLSGDGAVTTADFNLLAANFGSGCP